ncbi:MAG: PolC-type DNA polymerase III, partial [Clostridia bacterium]|nr:PolC-type DNA polymerase III [Clostridia bacterium]
MSSQQIGQDWRKLLGNDRQELAGHLTLEKVLVNREGTRITACFLADILVEESDFQAIKRAMVAAFPGMLVHVRVASPALAQDLVAHVDKYAPFLSACLVRHHPVIKFWLDNAAWRMDGPHMLELEMPAAEAVRFFKENGVVQRLERVLEEVFRLKAEVRVLLSDDHQRMLEELHKEKQRTDAALAASYVKPVAQAKPSASEKKVLGRAIADPAVPVMELNEESGRVVIRGEVVSAEDRELKGGSMRLLSFGLTDYTSTIQCKVFLRYKNNFRKGGTEDQKEPTEAERKHVQDVIKAVRPGEWLTVRGECRYDTFSRALTLMASDIARAEKPPPRADNAPQKRIELHLHTQMSSMDGVASAMALIGQAAAWGHPAVAITDHGVTQAFPEAFAAAAKNGVKLIPGVEGYLVDEGSLVERPSDRDLGEDIVVLDFETTGLSSRRDRIVEIGAVRMRGGQVAAEFSRLVNPGVPIPAKITEITGITDAMVRDAETANEAIPALLAFIGDAPVAAHNAPFDMGFLREECRRINCDCAPAVIDTLELSRRLYPKLKNHKLATVCKQLGVSLKNAHRAVHDATATAHALAKMLAPLRDKGIHTLNDLATSVAGGGVGGEASYHVILLAATQKGLENINLLVSQAHLHYFHRRPRIPRALLQKYRQGIIVGSACESGELFQAVLDHRDEVTLGRIARFYDYLEIQPVGNNEFLIRQGLVEDEEGLRDLNRKIVALGGKLGIPVVATGDVHFQHPKDAVFRAILMAGQGFEDADNQPPLYFKTTEEMLEEFAYLSPEKCQEVVIDNPRKIAGKIDDGLTLFPPHPEGKETFQPLWEGAADHIRGLVEAEATQRYGNPLPGLVRARLDKELKAVIGYGFATLYNAGERLVEKSLADGYLVGSRGSIGSSLMATLCGITEVNPLPPHYRCGMCRFTDFEVDRERHKVGVDLPSKECPECGEELTRDGYDIPFEVFLGFEGDKVPDIDLNFSGVYQPRAHAYVEELFGKDRCFRAGTIGTLADKTAYGFVSKYYEERGMAVTEAEKNRLVQGCVGVKRTTGQHPGGMVVLPAGYEIHQFTAIQHPADDSAGGVVTTHYDFGSMHDVLVKLDILGHDDPTMIRMLEDLSGVSPFTIPLTDPSVMSLFSSPSALGLEAAELGASTGTLGIPEFGTRFVRQMLEDTQPTTMEELIRISGLSHGTDVWLGNAQEL